MPRRWRSSTEAGQPRREKIKPRTWAARKALHQDLVWVPRTVLAPAFQLSVGIAHTQPNWSAATCVGD